MRHFLVSTVAIAAFAFGAMGAMAQAPPAPATPTPATPAPSAPAPSGMQPANPPTTGSTASPSGMNQTQTMQKRHATPRHHATRRHHAPQSTGSVHPHRQPYAQPYTMMRTPVPNASGSQVTNPNTYRATAYQYRRY
ncbi:hypothetical protein [Microvirga sp. 2TAF3]|uniref:hypothetical protein n=1 Tax=Microvirga sp. 2TAF3 TaxID=3233014 RepID=UPI003F987444